MHLDDKDQIQQDVLSDYDRIQGAWRFEALIQSGREAKREGVIEYYEGDSYWWELSSKKLRSVNSHFRLVETTNPKQIDLTSEDRTAAGIYRFNDDGTLTMCFCEESENRPTEFESSAENRNNLSVHLRLETV